MILESWWDSIPNRVDLKNAKFSAMNSEGYSLRNREIQTSELSTEMFIANYLVALYVSDVQQGKAFPESLTFELDKRATFDQAETDSAFSIFGTTHEEMQTRAKRVRMNLATLRGLDSLNFSIRQANEEEYNVDFIQEAQAKYLENLTDDEIAELATIADSHVIDWIPAHKEILIEAFERRGTGFED